MLRMKSCRCPTTPGGEDLGRTVTGERRSEGAELPQRELVYKYMTLQHPRRQTPEDK